MYHYGTLLDRFLGARGLVIRARDQRGRIVDVTVPPHKADSAARIHGGGTVRYAYRGGRPVYITPEEASYVN